MVIKDLDRFRELEESCGNKYLAVKFISQWARGFGTDYKSCHIEESKLIQWVLTGRCPYSKSKLESRRVIDDPDRVGEFLSWISDAEVVDEVIRLYKTSIQNRHLTCCEDSYFDPGKKSRINVLLRMLWFSTSTWKES